MTDNIPKTGTKFLKVAFYADRYIIALLLNDGRIGAGAYNRANFISARDKGAIPTYIKAYTCSSNEHSVITEEIPDIVSKLKHAIDKEIERDELSVLKEDAVSIFLQALEDK